MRLVAILFLVLVSTAEATYVPRATGAIVMVAGASCPAGWTDVTATYQGRYMAVKAATGSAGDTLGTAIADTATDLTVTGTVACTNPGDLSGIGAGGYCDNSPAPTVTLGSTADQRSEIAPIIYFRLCQLP